MIDWLTMIDKIKALLSTERNCFHLLLKKILILFYYIISYLLSSKHLLTCIYYNNWQISWGQKNLNKIHLIHHVTKKVMIYESDSCFFAMKIIIIVWMIACWPKGGNRFDKSTVIISKIFFELADKNSTNIIWSDLKSSKDVRRCVDDWLIDDDW